MPVRLVKLHLESFYRVTPAEACRKRFGARHFENRTVRDDANHR
jgi:hypothetical protein